MSDHRTSDDRTLDRSTLDRGTSGLVPVQHRPDHDLTEVRAWARSRGYPVDECASLPLDVLRTYRRVHAV